MRLLVEAANRAVGVAEGRIVPVSGAFDLTLRIPDGELRPGLINPHDHLHRNHYGRLGRPPYRNACAWGRDLHARDAEVIARGRALSRREALLAGAWKNLRAGVTTVVHHDPWEPAFEDRFPLRVARVRAVDSLGLEPGLTAPPAGEGPFAIHLAEGTDAAAAEEIRELTRRKLLTADLLAVHVVGADQDGVLRLRESGAAVVWCPTSNLFLFGRTAPPSLLAPGMDVLLGSDSLLTAAGDLLDELRAARALGLLSDERLADAVGAVAARRLGLAPPALEEGARADLVVLRGPLLEASARDVALVVAGGVVRVLDPALLPALGRHGDSGRVQEAGGVARWIRDDHPGPATGPQGQGSPRPTVSIVMATYNREALLRETIASVDAQTFTDWELLVADDGSTDGTRRYLESLDHPRIRPLFLPHSGTTIRSVVAAAREARGDWLAFLSDDDVWLPTKLARQLSQLGVHPDAGWSYTGYRIVDQHGAPVTPRPPTPFVPCSGWILEDLLAFRASASIVTLVVRRTLFEEIGGFDTTPELDLRADLDLAIRLAARSEAQAVADPLVVVRDHPARTTTNRGLADMLRANELVFLKAAAAAPNLRIRGLCLRQRAVQLANMVRVLSQSGEHRAAVRAFGRALRVAPLSPAVWRAGGGCLARVLGWRRAPR